MFCQHLRTHAPNNTTWSVATCAARNFLYVPSLGQQDRHCRSTGHRECPVLLRPETTRASLKWVEHGRCSLFPIMEEA